MINVAAGDLGDPAAKKYDIEAWFPSQERYREVTSCSNTTDFQARRLGIRFRGEHGLEPVHTLNGTATVDRVALAILENFQGACRARVPTGRTAGRPSSRRHPAEPFFPKEGQITLTFSPPSISPPEKMPPLRPTI